MNKQEEELIQYIIDQTQIDSETILRVLNHGGVIELSEKYEEALEDAENLNADSRIALEAARTMLKTDIASKGRKSKYNKEALKEAPEIVIRICRAFKEFYYRFLLG